MTPGTKGPGAQEGAPARARNGKGIPRSAWRPDWGNCYWMGGAVDSGIVVVTLRVSWAVLGETVGHGSLKGLSWERASSAFWKEDLGQNRRVDLQSSVGRGPCGSRTLLSGGCCGS